MFSRFAAPAALVFAAAAASSAGAAPRADVSGSPPQAAVEASSMGPWGFDLSGRDLSVRPGDDFNRYASGLYIDRTPIPADKSSYGAFIRLRDLSDARTRSILEAAAAHAPHVPVDDAGKIGAFYRAYMDEGRIEALGLKPLAPRLEAVRAAGDRAALARLMADAQGGFLPSLYGLSVQPDLKEPTRNTLVLTQSGLGLPTRDYYLKPEFANKKAAYQAYLARLLTLAGWPEPEARASEIVAFETRIAEASWSPAERRDPVATYNPMTVAELISYAPGFDWPAYLNAAGVGNAASLVVREKTAVPKIAAVYAETPMTTLQAWAAARAVDAAAPFLSKPFVSARFDFREKELAGTPQIEPRWERAVGQVGDLYRGMGDAVGRLYVARYFPPESKAKMEALVANLKAAFARRIEASDWMSPATKTAALEKLASFRIEIGYTSEWRDYANLTIRDDDLFGDVARSGEANWRFVRSHLGRPVDRAEWSMTPQTVNAYNAGPKNEVVFPAAILQPPFFDPKADPAVNYGGIGAVIGHEMTHSFDDQGRKLDAQGRLRDWWTAEDGKTFDARAARYGAEFAAYDTGVGVRINPKLTMGENIADLGGLNLALDAYHASLDGRPAPVLDGLTGDQRFFLGWAQVWRASVRPDALRRELSSDPHSPDMYRANTAERNIDAWYSAFDVKPGDKLYIAPAERVKIW